MFNPLERKPLKLSKLWPLELSLHPLLSRAVWLFSLVSQGLISLSCICQWSTSIIQPTYSWYIKSWFLFLLSMFSILNGQQVWWWNLTKNNKPRINKNWKWNKWSYWGTNHITVSLDWAQSPFSSVCISCLPPLLLTWDSLYDCFEKQEFIPTWRSYWYLYCIKFTSNNF